MIVLEEEGEEEEEENVMTIHYQNHCRSLEMCLLKLDKVTESRRRREKGKGKEIVERKRTKRRMKRQRELSPQ